MEGQENLIDVTCSRCFTELQVLDKDYPEATPCPKCKAPIGALIATARNTRDIMNTPLSMLAKAPPPKRFAMKSQEGAPPPPPPAGGGDGMHCPRHSDTLPTANCMNCSGPICPKCVSVYGYYCSAKCKDTVVAREPKTVKDDTQKVIDKKVDKALGAARSMGTKAGVIMGALLVLWIGYGVYTSFFGPKPKLTASLTVVAETFHAQYWKDDQALVQQDNDLFMVKLPTQQKLWKVKLGEMEEKLELKENSPPVPRGNASPEASLDFSGGGPNEEYRDSLRVDSIHNDHILIHSARQVIVVNAADGKVKWKFFKPDTFLSHVTAHEKGVACVLSSGRESQLTNLAWSNGAETWSNTAISGEDVISYNNQWVMLRREATAGPLSPRQEDPEAETNLDNEAVSALIKPLGKKTRLPSAKYQLEFVSLADGKSSGPQSLELKGRPHFQVTGNSLCLMAGTDLLVFRGRTEPAWKATLGAFPTRASSSGEVLAVSTQEEPQDYNPITSELAKLTGGKGKHASTSGIVTFDAKTGQQKWSKNDVDPVHLAVGPDGAVYATISVEKGQEGQGGGQIQHAVELSKGFKDPNAPIPVLLRLDAATGKTLWSAKYFGGEPLFFGDHVFVIQSEERMNLLASEIYVNDFTVSGLVTKTGKLFWSFADKGIVKQQQMDQGKFFLVTLKDMTPSGNKYHQSYTYWLQLLERK